MYSSNEKLSKKSSGLYEGVNSRLLRFYGPSLLPQLCACKFYTEITYRLLRVLLVAYRSANSTHPSTSIFFLYIRISIQMPSHGLLARQDEARGQRPEARAKLPILTMLDGCNYSPMPFLTFQLTLKQKATLGCFMKYRQSDTHLNLKRALTHFFLLIRV